MSEFELAWIQRRSAALVREDIVPAAAKMIAIQEVVSNRERLRQKAASASSDAQRN